MLAQEQSASRFWQGERGAEIVSHTLVQLLVLVLFSAILQLGFALYVRNVAVDAASETARYLSLQNASSERAQARAVQLVEAATGSSPRQVRFVEEEVGELHCVRVFLTVDLPVIGPWGVPSGLQVEALAWRLP